MDLSGKEGSRSLIICFYSGNDMGKKIDRITKTYSALQVANICGVVNQTAINWINNSHLTAFKTPGGQYRVYMEDLINFLESRNMKIPVELDDVWKRRNNNRVIIVEDDKDLSDMLKEFLRVKLSDCEIIQAFDGFEAGRVLVNKFSGIVILDIYLPGINGYEICKRIKKNSELASVKVIAISGMSDPDVEEKIMRMGADAFFKKPLDFKKLIAEIKGILKYRSVR